MARRGAYLLTPCAPGDALTEQLKQGGCLPAWWMTPGSGALEQICVPIAAGDATDFSRIIPWRDGYLWMVEQRASWAGVYPGGIYTAQTRPKELLKAFMTLSIFNSWALSPNGCRLAVQTREEKPTGEPLNVLQVLELC